MADSTLRAGRLLRKLTPEQRLEGCAVFISWNQWPFSSMQFSSDFAIGKSTLQEISRRMGWRRKNRPTASQPPSPRWPSPGVRSALPFLEPLASGSALEVSLGFPFLPHSLWPLLLSCILPPPPTATAPHPYSLYPAVGATLNLTVPQFLLWPRLPHHTAWTEPFDGHWQWCTGLMRFLCPNTEKSLFFKIF